MVVSKLVGSKLVGSKLVVSKLVVSKLVGSKLVGSKLAVSEKKEFVFGPDHNLHCSFTIFVSGPQQVNLLCSCRSN